MLVTPGPTQRIPNHAGILAGASISACNHPKASTFSRVLLRRMVLALAVASVLGAFAQQGSMPASIHNRTPPSPPPRVAAARQFLLRHGAAPRRKTALPASGQSSAGPATWQPLGPAGVVTANYGLVTGRISSLALDSSDPTGNRL